MPVTTIADLLRLLTREPGRPRITWYGPGGERVELSGAVLENWVNKTANLLVEEFDAGPGVNVRIDLPGHWRTVVWALAVWRVGACVVVGTDTAEADVVVSDRPTSWTASDVVAVSLPALARRFDGELPPGAIDAASAVMTYGDALGWAPEIAPDRIALDDGRTTTHGELATEGARRLDGTASDRVLSAAPALADAADLLAMLGRLAGNGSLVVVDEGLAATLRDDPDRRARLVRSERVDRDLLG